MPKRKTQEEFVIESKLVHGDKYDYSKSIYINNYIKMEIICKIHGSFWMSSDKHITSGQGCKICGIENNKNKIKNKYSLIFVERSIELHGTGKYGYDNSVYLGSNDLLEITCFKHGPFFQTPNDHLDGHGCKKCGIESLSSKRRMSLDEFILRAIEVHGNKYDYSYVIYQGTSIKIKVFCKKHGHGFFYPTPQNHLDGHGCSACKAEKIGNFFRLSLEEFILRAIEVHGNKYDYNHVIYQGMSVKIKITCEKHGEFSQIPSVHLAGGGCPKCKNSRGENAIIDYLNKIGINYHYQYKIRNFDGSYGRFDFVLDYGVIEFQGRQHYIPTSFGNKKENSCVKNFENVILRDLKKEAWCKKYSIPLICIPYWEIKNISIIIDKIILEKELTFSKHPEIVSKYYSLKQSIVENIDYMVI